MDFKRELVNHSHYVFVVAPLTKIIKFDDVDKLNNIVPYENLYDKFTIPIEKKESTFLLTSYRTSKSLSPLSMLSIRLKCVEKAKGNKNFTFCKDNPMYTPKGDKMTVRNVELPHSYIEDNFENMYGYKISAVQ